MDGGADNNAQGAQAPKIKRMDQQEQQNMKEVDETPPRGQEPGELQDQLIDHIENQAGEPSAPGSSQSIEPGKSVHFLYTRLNQNETKNLRKAQTNTEERRALAQIFGLKTCLTTAPNESPSKIELLKLDFHAMNFNFCVENAFSNEKVSTLLAILDHVFQRMLEKQLKQEVGLKLLRDHLADHSIQRPPFQIFIFTDEEVEKIVKFSLTTFLRHFALYEFAFKPRVELVLKCDPVFNTKFNAQIQNLDEMTVVEPEEAQKMKAFLGMPSENARAGDTIVEIDQGSVSQIQGSQGRLEVTSQDKSQLPIQGTGASVEDGVDAGSVPDSSIIDFKKVGKIYDKDTDLMDVIASEMNRINKAFDAKLTEHTEHCVNTVNSGKPLVEKDQATGVQKKK